MIFGKTKLELKVGLFVFLGLMILSVFILSIGKFRTWSAGYEASFIFNFVNGVKIGAPVRFAGVDVGEVKKIKLAFNPNDSTTKVKLICWLKKEARIPNDSTVWINTLGLLGEKYVEVIPGKEYENCLSSKQELTGIDPLAMHEVMRLAKAIADNLNEGITKILNKEGTVGKLLYDDDVYKELQALIVDIRKNPWKLFWKMPEKK